MAPSFINTHTLIRDYFLLDPSALLKRNEVLRLIIEQGPVLYIPEIEVYTISGQKAIREVIRNPHTFSSRHVTGHRVSRNYRVGLLNADPPTHTERKLWASKSFSQSHLKQRESHIQELVNTLIREFHDKGEFDLINDFANPITVNLTLAILGIPLTYFNKFQYWAIAHAAPVGNPNLSPKAQTKLIIEFIEFERFLIQLIETDQLENGLIKDLVQKMEDPNTEFTLKELVLMSHQILTAGTETTAKFLLSIFENLLENPQAYLEIQQNHALIPTLIEEVLRYKPPTHGMFRTATQETEILGYKIPKDAMLLLMYSSVGVDEEKVKCPFHFDLHRKSANHHLAFGSGIHYCLGAQLAKILANIVVTSLISQFQHMRISPNQILEAHPSYVFYGYKKFLIQFDPISKKSK